MTTVSADATLLLRSSASQRRDSQRLFVMAVLGILIALSAVALSGLAVSLGGRIPQENVQKDYALGALWAVVLGATILLWPIQRAEKQAVLMAWIAKTFVTLIVMLFYESHYPLDAYDYFFQARGTDFFVETPGVMRGRDIVVFVSFIQERLFDSYHALKVSFAMIGLVAIYVFYRAFAVLANVKSAPRLFYALAFFPSILFWSSILGKDPIALLAVAVYCYGVARWSKGHHVRGAAIAMAGILLAVAIRSWLGTILVVPLVVFAIRGVRGLFGRLAYLVLAAGAVYWVFSQFSAGVGIADVSDLPKFTETVSRNWAYGGSGQEIGTEFTSIPAMIAFMPMGIVTVLFRPLPGEVLNIFGLLSGAENLALVIFAIASIGRIRRPRVRHLLFRNPIFLWSVALTLVWSAVYGFVSYQNLGTSVRFRLPILPVVLGFHILVRFVSRSVDFYSRRQKQSPEVLYA